ncbi:APC family permease [Sciscionella marina]|uniref:APC family permease n=1 Tax=Sciscionella marina TaxID=508770 RepID=UPI0003670A33|nr:APC family permease [Sciscionella marina]
MGIESTPAGPGNGRLRGDALGVAGIVFLVLAAVAPLTGIIVIATLGIADGNGGGMPVSFLIAAVVLLLFGTGYAQMSRHVTSAGGFFAYVTRALGRPPGLVAAFVALLGYNCFVAGAIGTSGFFTAKVFGEVLGLHTPWQLWSGLSVLAVFLLGRRGVDVSAKLLGASLVLEVGILLVLDVAILLRDGLSLEIFAPSVMLSGSVGLGLLFAFNAFVGFEATGLFSEEARNPARTIPRATYTAVALIGLFAAFTSWCLISAVGAGRAGAVAGAHLAAGDFVQSIAIREIGPVLTDAMMLLLVVSLFAALLALHNSASRYLFALGRAAVLPKALGRTVPRTGAPAVASAVQIGFATAVAACYAIAGLDPVADLTASMTGIGTLGIIVLQAMAAIAIVVFFRRRHDRRSWKTLLAPVLGGLGLLAVTVLAVVNFGELAGSDSPVIAQLPWLLLFALAAGLARAWWMRRFRKTEYRELEHTEETPRKELDVRG